MATLFIVATPIGNLDDITLRAIKTLNDVDIVAAEDTRHSLQLLNHLGIKKPLLSCRAYNEESASDKVLEALRQGKNIAYVSDAGTPGVSDPGAVLVATVRQAGFMVSPVPGVSAFSAIVSVAGECGKTIIMEGFLSTKAARRRRRVGELLESESAFVLYESPHRIVKLLKDIADIESERRIVVGRELTKIHEEIVMGTARELLANFAGRERVLGEFVVLVYGKKSVKLSSQDADNLI